MQYLASSLWKQVSDLELLEYNYYNIISSN